MRVYIEKKSNNFKQIFENIESISIINNLLMIKKKGKKISKDIDFSDILFIEIKK